LIWIAFQGQWSFSTLMQLFSMETTQWTVPHASCTHSCMMPLNTMVTKWGTTARQVSGGWRFGQRVHPKWSSSTVVTSSHRAHQTA
jgi:hypothetical protein